MSDRIGKYVMQVYRNDQFSLLTVAIRMGGHQEYRLEQVVSMCCYSSHACSVYYKKCWKVKQSSQAHRAPCWHFYLCKSSNKRKPYIIMVWFTPIATVDR